MFRRGQPISPQNPFHGDVLVAGRKNFDTATSLHNDKLEDAIRAINSEGQVGNTHGVDRSRYLFGSREKKESSPRSIEIITEDIGRAASSRSGEVESFDLFTQVDSIGEDRGLVSSSKNFVALGDGMGGGPDGEKAAEVVVISAGKTLDLDFNGLTINEATSTMENILWRANDELALAKEQKVIEYLAGTTLVATKAFVAADGLPYLAWASAGNSTIALESGSRTWDINLEETMAADVMAAASKRGDRGKSYLELMRQGLDLEITNPLSGLGKHNDSDGTGVNYPLRVNYSLSSTANAAVIPLVPNENGCCRIMLSSDAVAGVFKDRVDYRERPNDFSEPGDILPEFQAILGDYSLTAEEAAQKIHDLARTGIPGCPGAEPSTDDCLVYVMDIRIAPKKDAANEHQEFWPEKGERFEGLKRIGRAAARLGIYAPFIRASNWRWRTLSSENEFVHPGRIKGALAGLGGVALKVGVLFGAAYFIKNGFELPHFDINLPDWFDNKPGHHAIATPSVETTDTIEVPDDKPTTAPTDTPAEAPKHTPLPEAEKVSIDERTWRQGGDADKLHLYRDGDNMVISAEDMAHQPKQAIVTVDGQAYQLDLGRDGQIKIDDDTQLGKALRHGSFDYLEAGTIKGEHFQTFATEVGSGDAAPITNTALDTIDFSGAEKTVSSQLSFVGIGEYTADIKASGNNYLLHLTSASGHQTNFVLTPSEFSPTQGLQAAAMERIRRRLGLAE